MGCGECSLLKKLKFHQEIELLVGVDINGAKIKKKKYVKCFSHTSLTDLKFQTMNYQSSLVCCCCFFFLMCVCSTAVLGKSQ